MPMKKPPHPGHSIKDACLVPLGLSVTAGAKVLDVARHTLSRVVNGQAGISPEMAIRLEKTGLLERRPVAQRASRLRSGAGAAPSGRDQGAATNHNWRFSLWTKHVTVQTL